MLLRSEMRKLRRIKMMTQSREILKITRKVI